MRTFEELRELFSQALTGEDHDGQDEFCRLIISSMRTHLLLWKCEDLCRVKEIGFERIAKAKFEIDRLNQIRNENIRLVDQQLDKLLLNNDKALEYQAESPGMLIDRLAILYIKSVRIKALLGVLDPGDLLAEYSQKEVELGEQLNDTGTFLEQLLKKINSGQVHFKIYTPLKLYNDERIKHYLKAIDKGFPFKGKI